MELVLQLVANGLIAGSLYSLIAMSFGLIYGATHHFHIAHAAVFASSAYTCAVLTTAGAPLIVSLLGAVALSTALGWAIARFVYEPLNRRGRIGMGLFIASLGLVFVVENAFALLLGNGLILGPSVPALKRSVQVGPVSITVMQIGLIVLAVLVLVVLLFVLQRTSLGARVRALSADPELMRIRGKRPEGTQRLVYLIGSLIAGIAGSSDIRWG